MEIKSFEALKELRIPKMFGRFYGNDWPFYASSAGLLGEFLRKSLAVRCESTEKIGQAES